MKKIVLLLTVLFTAIIAVKAQTADDIINNYVKALGGMDKINSIKSVYMEANMNANGTELPVKMWQMNEKAMRIEFEVSGMKCYSIITKDSGWNYMPIMGQTKPEPMPGDAVKMAQSQLDIHGSLVNYKAKGNKVELLGKDDVDGTEAYKLSVTLANGKVKIYYIDPATYYPIREVEKATVNGVEQEGKTDLANYTKSPDGFVYPATIISPQGAIKISSFKVNTEMADNLFKPAR